MKSAQKKYSSKIEISLCVTISASNAKEAMKKICRWETMKFQNMNSDKSKFEVEALDATIGQPEPLTHNKAFTKMSTEKPSKYERDLAHYELERELPNGEDYNDFVRQLIVRSR